MQSGFDRLPLQKAFNKEKSMKRIWIVLGILLGVAVIIGVGYLGFRSSKPESPIIPQTPDTDKVSRCDVDQSVTAPGSVSNIKETAIDMPVDGKLDEILVRLGDKVKTGDVLATFQTDPVQIAKAKLALVEAQKKLSDAITDRDRFDIVTGNPETIEVAAAKLALANQRLNDAQLAYDRVSNLPKDDPMRAQALIALDGARSEQRKALYVYNLALGGNPSPADIAKADATLALAQANVVKAQTDLDLLSKTTITAPFDGVILETKAETNKTTPAGTNLFIIHSPKDIEIQANVVEEDYPYVEVGQKVELYFDALPDVEASGVVSRILAKRNSGDRPLYDIYISLDQIPEHLVQGMTVDAAVFIAQRTQVLCLPRAIVHAASGNTVTVKVWDGVKTEDRQIEIGLRGDVYLEILSGLEEGEQVVTR
jgi:RND family efflux transporter MFP subunit